jgi:hypothetical protein
VYVFWFVVDPGFAFCRRGKLTAGSCPLRSVKTTKNGLIATGARVAEASDVASDATQTEKPLVSTFFVNLPQFFTINLSRKAEGLRPLKPWQPCKGGKSHWLLVIRETPNAQ